MDCLKRARLDEGLQRDFHTLCLEGCRLFFGGSACSELKQPPHSTNNVQTNTKHVQPTHRNKTHQSCACALLAVFARGSIAACPLQAPHSTNSEPIAFNKDQKGSKHTTSFNKGTTSRPPTAKQQQVASTPPAATGVASDGDPCLWRGLAGPQPP